LEALRHGVQRRWSRLQRLARLDLVHGISRTADTVNEHPIAPRGLDSLHDPVPTLVATPGAYGHDQPVVVPTGRSLDLYAVNPFSEVSDEVAIRIGEHRQIHAGAGADQPVDRRQFAGIPLAPRCPHRFHAMILRPGPDVKALQIPTSLQQFWGRTTPPRNRD